MERGRPQQKSWKDLPVGKEQGELEVKPVELVEETEAKQ